VTGWNSPNLSDYRVSSIPLDKTQSQNLWWSALAMMLDATRIMAGLSGFHRQAILEKLHNMADGTDGGLDIALSAAPGLWSLSYYDPLPDFPDELDDCVFTDGARIPNTLATIEVQSKRGQRISLTVDPETSGLGVMVGVKRPGAHVFQKILLAADGSDVRTESYTFAFHGSMFQGLRTFLELDNDADMAEVMTEMAFEIVGLQYSDDVFDNITGSGDPSEIIWNHPLFKMRIFPTSDGGIWQLERSPADVPNQMPLHPELKEHLWDRAVGAA
jgi:hypothetical protein